MARYWSQLALTTRSFALAQTPANNELAKDMNRTEAMLEHLNDSEAYSTCKHLSEVITGLVASLAPYGVDNGIINAGNDLINTFGNLLGKYKEAQTHISVAVLDNLTKGVHFSDNSSFVQGYFASRAIDDLPSHHTELIATIKNKNTGAPLAGITVTETESGKKAISNNIGIADMVRFRGGDNLRFTISGNGYTEKTIIQTVKRGKKVEITVEMESV